MSKQREKIMDEAKRLGMKVEELIWEPKGGWMLLTSERFRFVGYNAQQLIEEMQEYGRLD